MKQGLAFHDFLDREDDPNQGCDHDEAQLPGGEERRPVNRTNVELGLGLDEINHQLGESQEIALVHLLQLLRGLVRSDEADWARRENLQWRVLSWSSDLSWSWVVSKKMRR